MQGTTFKTVAHVGNGRSQVVVVAEIDLDVIFRACFPWTMLRERHARAGNYPPAGAGKSLYCRVADAAAGAGQYDGAFCCLVGHPGFLIGQHGEGGTSDATS